MAENIRKYEDSIKKTVKVLSETTAGIESKIRELVLVLSAVNQGFLTKEEQIVSAIEGVTKGKFEGRALIKQYLKQLNVADDALEKIVDQYVTLEQKSLDQIKLTEEYIRLERDLHIKLDDRNNQQTELIELQYDENDELERKVDLVTDLVKKYQEFSSNVNANESTLKNLNIDLTSTSKGITQFLNNASDVIPNLFNFDDTGLKKYSAQLETIGKSLKNGEPTVKLPEGNETIEVDMALENVGKLISKIKPQIDQEIDYRTKAFNMYITNAMGLEGEAAAQKFQQLSSIAARLEGLGDLSKDNLDILNLELKTLSLQDQIYLGQYVSSGKILKTNLEDLATTEEKLKQLEHANKITDSYSKKIQQIGMTLRNTIDYMPLGLQRMLGIDEIDQQISGALTTSIKTFNTNIAMGEGRMIAAAKAAKTFGSSFSTMLGPIGIVAATIGTIVMLVKTLEDGVSNISKEMGISRSTAKEINNITMDMVTSSSNKLATEEQILAIQKEYLESNGQLLDLTKKNNQDLVQTAVLAEQAYGIMNTEAMGVMSTFKSLGADDSLAQQLLADVGHMATLAGMSPNVIAKDMIEGAKELSLYFGGMPKQAAKAAIQIRRMGMSIKQAGVIADKMLNIESFMTDMTELSAMTSGRLNLSEAFDLRMQGDLVGMTESVMKNIGSLNQFNSESEFVQRKLASTLGMEVTDLRKSLKLREMQAQLGEQNAKLLQDNLDKVGDIENMSVENMKAKAEELNSTKQLGIAFAKIKTVLYKALVPLVETFSETLASSTGIIESIGIGFKAIGGVIKLITPIVQGFLLPFKWIGNAIGYAVDIFEQLFGSTKKTDTVLTGMNSSLLDTTSIITTVGKVIGGVFGGAYLAKLLGLNKIFSGVFSTISTTVLDKMKGLSSGILSTLTKPTIFKTISDKFKSIEVVKPLTDNIKSKLPGITSIFDKINPFKKLQDKSNEVDLLKPLTEKIDVVKTVTQSDDVTKNITESVKTSTPDLKSVDKTSSIFEKVSSVIKKGIDIIKEGFTILKNFISGVLDTIVETLTKLGSGIGNFIENTLGGLGNGLSKFKPQALIGAAALTIISGALWITSKAMDNFNNINWDSLAKAGISIAGLGIIAAGFGTMSGLILTGAVAITAVSGSLWIFTKAIGGIGDIMSKIQPIMESFMAGVDKVASTISIGINQLFTTLASIDATQLLAIGPALLGIAAGLAAISAGSIVNGITSLFTADPFVKLEKVALLAEPMNVVANSVKILTDSITQLGSVLSNTDFEKLGKIADSSIKVNKELNIDTGRPVIESRSIPTATLSTTNSIPTVGSADYITQNQTISNQSSTEKQISISTVKMEKLLAEVRDALYAYSTRPVTAIIGPEGVKSFNNSLKGLNNR